MEPKRSLASLQNADNNRILNHFSGVYTILILFSDADAMSQLTDVFTSV